MKPKLLSMMGTMGVAAGASFVTWRLSAAEPEVTPLTYRGYLETPDGAPVTGVHNVGIRLMDAEEGGNERCELRPSEVSINRGWFTLMLPEECAEAIAASTELWLGVEIDGAELGRSKLGAVPYAIQANAADAARHATSCDRAIAADSATTSANCTNANKAATADGASGALEQRLAALERRTTTIESIGSKFLQQIDTVYIKAADGLGGFAESCVETKAMQACSIAAHRKCREAKYATGWFIGEQATSNGATILAVACVKPYPALE